jgi:hypothetical protein
VKRTWNLREELYQSLHRWPTMLALFAVGCLLGVAFSYVWPPYYRAISEIYVALNPYRTYSDSTFLALTKPKYSNLDNYLFWQMAQLEESVYIEEYIQETLTKLRQTDPYWKDVTEDQFRAMLDSDWRTAGKWSLIVQNKNAEHAEQAARTWSETVKEGTDLAILSARDTFMLDEELKTISEKRLQSKLRTEELHSTQEALLSWLDANSETELDQQLQPAERWELLAKVVQPALFTPSWQSILEQQPPPKAPIENYLQWVEQILPIIEIELASLEERITSLDEQYEQISVQYSIEADNSLGLSPNLAIEEVHQHPPKIIRPTSTLALIGGILGLLIWVLTQLVMITKQTKNGE